MDIVLVRHGESEDNINKVFSRDYTELTKNGIAQIQITKERLEHYNLEEVYFSPLKRTRQTMEYLEITGIEDDRIREMNFGIFTGHTFEEYNSKYPLESKSWMDDPFRYTIPNGENIIDTYGRVAVFIDEIVGKGQNTLVITHEGIIRLACCWVIDNPEMFFKFRADNGSISVITVNESHKYIKQLNSR